LLMKIKCLVDVHRGISLKKGKIYEARQGQLGWFALIDETGEEYVYPPDLFESKRQTLPYIAPLIFI